MSELLVVRGSRRWRFPYHCSVPAGETVAIFEGTARLPQHAEPKAAQARRRELARRQERYAWATPTDGLPGQLSDIDELDDERFDKDGSDVRVILRYDFPVI